MKKNKYDVGAGGPSPTRVDVFPAVDHTDVENPVAAGKEGKDLRSQKTTSHSMLLS